MKLVFFCPRWGSESLSLAEFIRKVGDASYDGIEVGLADGDVAVDLPRLVNGARVIELNQIPSFEDHFTDALTLRE
jgi:hypothetical protein